MRRVIAVFGASDDVGGEVVPGGMNSMGSTPTEMVMRVAITTTSTTLFHRRLLFELVALFPPNLIVIF